MSHAAPLALRPNALIGNPNRTATLGSSQAEQPKQWSQRPTARPKPNCSWPNQPPPHRVDSNKPPMVALSWLSSHLFTPSRPPLS
ncbi:hypothetical protein ACFX2F_025686 [Malus domestica]